MVLETLDFPFFLKYKRGARFRQFRVGQFQQALGRFRLGEPFDVLLGILDRASQDQSSCERNAVLSD